MTIVSAEFRTWTGRGEEKNLTGILVICFSYKTINKIKIKTDIGDV